MATLFSVPIEAFFRRVEADKGFFNYLNLTDQQALELATQRATGYLYEACARICFECPDGSDFLNYNETDKTFNFDLTKREVMLLASIMYEMYLNRDIAKIRLAEVNYTGKELTVFDPSNARRTMLEMYNTVCAENNNLLDKYKDSEASGAWKTIDFTAYDEGE